MAQIKAHEFDRFAASPLSDHHLFLLYGPDRGLVSERADIIAGRTGIDRTDPFAVHRFEADDLRTDPGRLAEEAQSIGLFGGDRLVWVRGAGNDRSLVTAVAGIAEKPAPATTIVIEAGDLKKGSALRKTVEQARGCLAIPCYSDERRGIHALIDAELSEAGLRITPDARDRLAGSLGGDRLASRAELRKLALYCYGSDQVTEADVAASVGDTAAVSVDDAVDAVLIGDLSRLDVALQRIIASKTAVSTVLLACQRQFQQLDRMRAVMQTGKKSVADVMASEARQVHFRRKPALEAALARWHPHALVQVLDHFHSAILQMRRRPQIEDDIARHALLAVTQRANRLGRQ